MLEGIFLLVPEWDFGSNLAATEGKEKVCDLLNVYDGLCKFFHTELQKESRCIKVHLCTLKE
jgi:hypothetical protein